jgi:hypothetical protein
MIQLGSALLQVACFDLTQAKNLRAFEKPVTLQIYNLEKEFLPGMFSTAFSMICQYSDAFGNTNQGKPWIVILGLFDGLKAVMLQEPEPLSQLYFTFAFPDYTFKSIPDMKVPEHYCGRNLKLINSGK